MTDPRETPDAVPPTGPDAVLQRVELELYRDNIGGALDLLEQASRGSSDPRFEARAREIRSWLAHLGQPEAYGAAYERFYHVRRGTLTLRHLERTLRILFGRKTRKTVARVSADPEFRLLDDLVTRCRPARVLDAGCGEGRVAMTLGARHSGIEVTGIDVSRTNIGLARGVNRFGNVTFREALIERFLDATPPESFDLVYSFAVLEHVPDVDEVMRRFLRALRPHGHVCFIVPMNEFAARGPLPAFRPPDGVLGHVRCFSESGLRAGFGHHPDFVCVKVPGRWRPERYPPEIVPVEFGSFFVAFRKS